MYQPKKDWSTRKPVSKSYDEQLKKAGFKFKRSQLTPSGKGASSFYETAKYRLRVQRSSTDIRIRVWTKEDDLKVYEGYIGEFLYQ